MNANDLFNCTLYFSVNYNGGFISYRKKVNKNEI